MLLSGLCPLLRRAVLPSTPISAAAAAAAASVSVLRPCPSASSSSPMSSASERAARSLGSRILFAQDDPTGEVPDGFAMVKEGSAKVLFHVPDRDSKEVFYNEVQETNRDLSIACIRTFDALRRQETEQRLRAKSELAAREGRSSASASDTQVQDLRIFEGLAASGIRSIRYWQEIPNVGTIVVNDLEEAAVESIRRNQELNGITSPGFVPNRGDASMVMYQHREAGENFHVVDLDPYGSAIPFMDAGVQAVSNGGLLCVTCTDASVLCGNNPETCFYKYGAVPLHYEYGHEMAVRIVLASLAASAGRYQRYIEPQLSLFVDFYIRVFVRVYRKPSIAKETFSRIGMIHQSTGCDSFYVQPLGRVLPGKKEHLKKFTWAQVQVPSRCPETGRKMHIGGPVWIDRLHNPDFVQAMLQHLDSHGSDFNTLPRLNAMLHCADQELPVPLYYIPSSMCKKLHLSVPSIQLIRSAIMNMGYSVSVTHCNSQGLKTDCPPEKLWDILRAYSASIDFTPKGEISKSILSKKPSCEVDFTYREEGSRSSRKVPLFLPNPAENWGPKSRASGKKRSSSEALTSSSSSSSASTVSSGEGISLSTVATQVISSSAEEPEQKRVHSAVQAEDQEGEKASS